MLQVPRRVVRICASVLFLAVGANAQADLLVASYYSNSVLRFTDAGAFVQALGPPAGAGPIGVAVGPDGGIFASFAYVTFLSKYDTASQSFVPFTTGGSLHIPHQIAIGGPANDLYSSDLAAAGVQAAAHRFSGTTGEFQQAIALPPGVHSGITGIAVDRSGVIYMAGRVNTSIYKYADNSLTLLTTTGFQLDGLTIGPDGKLYVGAALSNVVLRFSTDGTPFGANGNLVDPTFINDPAHLNLPFHVAFGGDGLIYVANQGSGVVRYTPAGSFVDTFIAAGAGGMAGPTYLAFTTTPDSTSYAMAVTKGLSSSVTALVASGVLTADSAAPLSNRLSTIEKKLGRDKSEGSVASLNAFIKKVGGMAKNGRLPPEQAQTLISAAEGAINSLR